MCTAITFQTKDFYFGRTLDYDFSFGEQVTVTPRNYPFHFRHGETLEAHYAIIGMAHIADGYPLYYDAVNEKGLGMAGLNFVGFAKYAEAIPGQKQIAQFEFIPWVLSRCSGLDEVRRLLEGLSVTATAFREDLPAAQLHWIIADASGCITVESTKNGLQIHDNPVGVMTNNPEFDDHLFSLNDYIHLSPCDPQNTFAPQLPLWRYSRGMGAMGLPGDLSSRSRFIRAAFMKSNSVCADTEQASIGQFFHIMDTISQPNGCCRLSEGQLERTVYTSCCNATKGIYYYTTYENRSITAVDIHAEDLDGRELASYPLCHEEQIRFVNR